MFKYLVVLIPEDPHCALGLASAEADLDALVSGIDECDWSFVAVRLFEILQLCPDVDVRRRFLLTPILPPPSLGLAASTKRPGV